ncbi:hypothetical protein OQX63_16315 [Pedobacter sp. PF22-3]|uniref:hypothetical protein n=1 Tax=Pedobacter sp. PF22-3 TaxID=2994467 RepID=UPI002245054C|nr:hypothetical protein [Pedobacter sp. PF22-3]MCX2495057.1 hypothetical protein [Pedobacter sp. PF22-3]
MQPKIALLPVPPKPDRSGSDFSSEGTESGGCSNLKASAPDFQKKDNGYGIRPSVVW